MPTKTRSVRSRKVTFSLRQDILDAMNEAVTKGITPSKNALVEQALRHELKEIRRRMMAAEWERAAKDPLFVGDVEEVREAFETADAETARAIR